MNSKPPVRAPMRKTTRLAAVLCATFVSTFCLGAEKDVRLAEASKRGDKAAVRVLLQQRSDVNAVLPDGTTALHWAVRADDVEMTALLIRAGAKVAATDRYGVTPLSLASLNASPGMIETLIRAGADPNSANPYGETALMTAARRFSASAPDKWSCIRSLEIATTTA